MEENLFDVMDTCRNFFVQETQRGTFRIVKGTIRLNPQPVVGSYMLVSGSYTADGVYKVTSVPVKLPEEITETFEGSVSFLAPPKAFLKLAEDIRVWREANETPEALTKSQLQSETYRGYSYSMAQGRTGQLATWKDVFETRLDDYRKMFRRRGI